MSACSSQSVPAKKIKQSKNKPKMNKHLIKFLA